MGMDSKAEKMIFVVGNSRSGTTMLGRILSLNSAVYTFGEIHFFEQLVGFNEFSQNQIWAKDKALRVLEKLITRAREGFFAPYVSGRYSSDAQTILSHSATFTPMELYATFLKKETARVGRSVPCEQTPRYIFSAREILSAYPNARIINMIRDPRDVMMSQRLKWKRRYLGGDGIPLVEAIRAWSNYHPWLCSRLWRSCITHATTIKDDRFISIRFEDILSDPKKKVGELCDFLDITFNHTMLEAPQIGSSSGQDGNGRNGINKDRASGWRKHGIPRSPRLLCEWVCKDEMRNYGYKDFLREGRFSVEIFLQLLSFPMKIILALILNIRRFPHLIPSIKKRFTK